MTDPRTRRQLLRDLTGAGVGAASVGLIGRDLLGTDTDEVADAATPSCTLTPEVTQGPYYLDLDKVRRNITEGKRGLRLDVRIKVVDASTCKVHEDAAVEIWHCDAGGTYSGFS
jgi:protocatechuate 3,4-dioxygenase beta subunit